jgi:hypothetical protein
MRPLAGRARPSMQVQVAFVAPGADRGTVEEVSTRRFGWGRALLGSPDELVDTFGALAGRGVERLYVWFTDFAPTETLAAFGETVIAQLGVSPPA